MLFTQSDYLKIHIVGIAVALIAAATVGRFPNRFVVFVFLTFVFTPSVFYNTIFHVGATLYFHAYCPGVLTAVVLYLPLFWFVISRAHEGRWIGARTGLVSFSAGAVFHAVEVGHNVFKAW